MLLELEEPGEVEVTPGDDVAAVDMVLLDIDNVLLVAADCGCDLVELSSVDASEDETNRHGLCCDEDVTTDCPELNDGNNDLLMVEAVANR